MRVSCQVPRFVVDARPLAAELGLPNNPDIEMKRKAALERERAEAKSVWDLLMVVFMLKGACNTPPTRPHPDDALT